MCVLCGLNVHFDFAPSVDFFSFPERVYVENPLLIWLLAEYLHVEILSPLLATEK